MSERTWGGGETGEAIDEMYLDYLLSKVKSRLRERKHEDWRYLAHVTRVLKQYEIYQAEWANGNRQPICQLIEEDAAMNKRLMEEYEGYRQYAEEFAEQFMAGRPSPQLARQTAHDAGMAAHYGAEYARLDGLVEHAVVTWGYIRQETPGTMGPVAP
jgi:hypothetical protein